MPAENAPAVRDLIRRWLDQRIVFYERHGERRIGQVEAEREKLQAELWWAVLPVASAYPTPVIALAVAGMNDMLNAQSRTQGAWWNRIPAAAWGLMVFIAIACNGLRGYSERRRGALLLLVVPIVVSISVLLIADIDSPRGGIIGVSAHADRALPIHKSAVGYGNSRALDFTLADAQGSRDCRLVVFVAVGRRLCASAVAGSG